MSLNLNITGYSTALFSTWYFIDELNLLFDCGDGFSSMMLQKSRKARHAFISHPDRDHLTGLLQFAQLNARGDFPRVYYPRDSGSFPYLEAFTRKFDPHVRMPAWTPLKEGDEIQIGEGGDQRIVKAIRNGHVRAPEGVIKSMSFQVFSLRRKLKAELKELPGHELGRMRQELGEDAVTDELRINTLSYSGDSPVEQDDRYRDSEVLIHEATFLDHKNDAELHGNRHSALPDVLEMVADSNIKKLVLGHFSSRYSQEEIDTKIRKGIKDFGIRIPVYRVLPGEVVRDILNGEPIN